MDDSLKNHSATDLLEALTERIKADARAEAVNMVIEKLGEGIPRATTAVRVAAPKRAGRVKAVRKAGRAERGTRGARADEFLAFVKKNPGQRGEQIASALDLDRADMVAIRRELDGKIKTKGARRGMCYFAKAGA